MVLLVVRLNLNCCFHNASRLRGLIWIKIELDRSEFRIKVSKIGFDKNREIWALSDKGILGRDTTFSLPVG